MLLLGAAVIIGILLGLLQAQKISAELKIISTDIKEASSEIKNLKTSTEEVKASLAEKDIVAFRRDMQESGRRMLSMDYAGKFERWDAAKMEIDELNNTLESAANLRHDLAQSIRDFRGMYIPKLRDAADKKDTKNFEAVWSDTYNACVSCHKGSVATP
jgi:DNA-directed RNA polymerase subunit F